MAYGTKELEVAANELGRQALQVAMDEADSFLSLVVQGHDETAKNVSSMKLRIQAKTMREKADDSARKIGEAYDVYQYARGHRHFPPK